MGNTEHVLLVNLGSPKSLKVEDVHTYLKEFLSDDLVIDLPKLVQQALLRCFILPFRPKKTKEAYELIWSEAGSPLLVNTQNIADALSEQTGWRVDIAMRYQEPSLQGAINQLKQDGVKNTTVVPLYPHNAMSTTTTTENTISKIVQDTYPELHVNYVRPFFDHPSYIHALARSIERGLPNKPQQLLFSYHGIPERHVRKPDPTGSHCLSSPDCCATDCEASNLCYRSNVITATEKVVEELGMQSEDWSITFQSRVTVIDPKWLRPYTDKVLEKLPDEGITDVAVVCPSFVADCLETLEEIDIRGRKTFMDAGGQTFTWVPCMNESPEFIDCLKTIITELD